jgi:GNAT superfamily N-acetyltransferase
MSSELSLATAYWDDPASRSAFKNFMSRIFGLDFSEWESAGYWDDRYTPFSYFRGGEVVANVCVYLLDAVIEGRRTRLAQISGVGTLPHKRRQGLSRELTETGLRWARDKHEGVFLFANDEAVPFYEHCGFRAQAEYVQRVAVPTVLPCSGLRKLDCKRQEDRDKLFRYAEGRSPISDRFAILNPKLVMFHALCGLREHVYEIPDLQCAVFFTRSDGCIRLLDVVGARVPKLDRLYPYLAHEEDQAIEFHFFCDKMGVRGAHLAVWPHDNCFVKGSFPLEKPVFCATGKA